MCVCVCVNKNIVGLVYNINYTTLYVYECMVWRQQTGWIRRPGVLARVLLTLTRENLLKIAVTADELREVNVYKVCVQPLDGSEFTVHVDVAACRISDLNVTVQKMISLQL